MSTLTYKDAGVDIDAGNELVRRIKPFAKATARPEVMGGLGGFGALFQLPLSRYQQPILVSTTDGVGSKLKLAMAMKQHHTIGIDLVAMCVNDIIVQGAEPLFFLDYYATGQLSVDIAATVIESIAKGCEMAGCALVGGETAEMPGMYSGDDYDLAGFCVGIVDTARLIRPERVKVGDVLLGLAASGLHSNGFSLVRKIIELSSSQLHTPFEKSTLGETLLVPTRIYVKPLLKLFEKINVHAAAHITGGGLLENVPRVLPPHTKAVIERSRWQRPAIFDWLQSQGNIADNEMLRTFNCGIGMVLVVDEKDAKTAMQLLTQAGETVQPIGVIESSVQSEPSLRIS